MNDGGGGDKRPQRFDERTRDGLTQAQIVEVFFLKFSDEHRLANRGVPIPQEELHGMINLIGACRSIHYRVGNGR